MQMWMHFSMTCHSGLLLIKDEHKGKLDYKFLLYLLNNHLPNFSKGEGNRRLKKAHLEKDVEPVKIPVDDEGNYDIKKQREIANKYEIIEEIKGKLKEDYRKILECSIQIS